MRILTVVNELPWDGHGGVHNYVRESCVHLRRRGHDIVLLGRRVDPRSPSHEVVDGFDVWRHDVGLVHSHVAWPFLTSRHFRVVYGELHNGTGFDLVNVHCPEPDHPLAKTAVYAATPSVATFHASWLDEIAFEARRIRYARTHWKHYVKPLWIRLVLAQKRYTEHRILDRAHRVVVLSSFMKGRAEALHSIDAAKTEIVPSGVDTERFCPCPDRSELRRRHGLPADRPILFTARRLVARTGVEELIDAMAAVVEQVPNAHLLVAGKGYLSESLEHRVSELGLTGSVRLLGFVDEATLVDLYRAADLFVLPTVALEGFGIATIEALACGTPALGTRVGATPEILSRVDPSLVVDEPTPRCLANGLLSWLNAPARLTGIRQLCRDVALAHYSWERVAARLEQVFDRTIAARQERSHSATRHPCGSRHDEVVRLAEAPR